MTAINQYFKAVSEAYSLGNVETSYNAPIIALLTAFGCKPRDLSGSRKGAIGENTDIELWRNDEETAETEPFAAVEVKRIEGRDARAKDQVKKAADRYGNAILTDNLVWEFWKKGDEKWYSAIELIEKSGDKLILKKDRIEIFTSLMEDFVLRDPVFIKSSDKLAEYMAIHAKTIRNVILGVLKDDGKGNPLLDERQTRLPMFIALYGLYSKIKEDLRPTLNSRDFADMYAQTIVYGLFIARYNDKNLETFDKYEAIGKLREESALLNRFFTHIASTGSGHPTLDVVIDKLCALYKICDISAILDNDKRHDAIVHFYENFLAYYDPSQRKARGVFYTPYQVVQYMVSMTDKMLAEDLKIEGGLSNNETIPFTVIEEQNGESVKKKLSVPRVAVLDPACGTGTFAVEIIKHIKKTYFNGAKSPFFESYIKEKNGLLSRLIGFEIMMTSYAVSHLNIRRAVRETLGKASDTQLQSKIYLTNTLTRPHAEFERSRQLGLFDFSQAITDEAYNADTWKIRRPIKVIIGNPPYLAASTNPYDISAYKFEVDGKSKLQEKNSKLLNDDYVKFFRFAQKIIERDGEGVLAYISNNGYLDNPTFRGMRSSLLRTFDKIFIVNLHGNAIKKETAPDGSKDENIFAIMQGACIFIGVKNTKSAEWAKVQYADIWGLREKKFEKLLKGDIDYAEVKPDKKMAYLMPLKTTGENEYKKGVSLDKLFNIYSNGMKLARDALCIQNSKEELELILKDFQIKEVDKLRDEYKLGKDSRDWTVAGAKKDIESFDGIITKIAYRPFDDRWTYFSGRSRGFHEGPRNEIMRHFIDDNKKNIGLCFPRQDRTPGNWCNIFITDKITDKNITSTVYHPSIAPLYLKPNELETEWQVNFKLEQLNFLTQNLKTKPSSEEIFDYIYGILYDPGYRKKYNEFLKRDYPRVPVIKDEKTFRYYSKIGNKLRLLHLMQEKVPVTLTMEPATSENLEINNIKYSNGVLYLNENKKILGITQDVWNYRIGGYQVLDKWLKSHKGEKLTIDHITHLENVTGLIAETIKIQKGMMEKNEE